MRIHTSKPPKLPGSTAPKVGSMGLGTGSGIPKPHAGLSAPHARFLPKKSAIARGAFGGPSANAAFPAVGSLPGGGGGAFGGM